MAETSQNLQLARQTDHAQDAAVEIPETDYAIAPDGVYLATPPKADPRLIVDPDAVSSEMPREVVRFAGSIVFLGPRRERAIVRSRCGMHPLRRGSHL